jgi:hypothetical protein
MASYDDCKLYLNVWTTRKPKGLTRSKEIPYYHQDLVSGIYKKVRMKTLESDDIVTHTHMCDDLFDHFVIKEPGEREFGDLIRVPDCVV